MCNSRRLASAAAAVALFVSARASAEEAGKRTSSLAWVRLDGAESCIAGNALAQRVEDRLRRKVFVSATDADLAVEGSIGPAPKGGGFRAVLRVTSRDGKILGSRDVETRSAHCDAIDDKLSLVISVLIDPDGDAAPDEPPAAAPLPPPPTIVERERVVVVHDAPPAPPQRLRFELAVAAGGLAGLQPDVGAAVVPSVVVSLPHFWPILLAGGIGASTTTDTVRGANADVSLAYGALSLCPLEAERGRMRALVCAGALIGALRSTGMGFDTTASTSSLVAGPVLDGRVTLTVVGPLLALLSVDVLVPISRPEVGYSSPAGESTLFHTGAVGAIGSLGLGVKFP